MSVVDNVATVVFASIFSLTLVLLNTISVGAVFVLEEETLKIVEIVTNE